MEEERTTRPGLDSISAVSYDNSGIGTDTVEEEQQTTRLGLDKVVVMPEDYSAVGGMNSEDGLQINYSKPWRIVIRRTVCDGRSNYEDTSESNEQY